MDETRNKVFWIPALFPDAATDELNAFLARHRVLELERKFCDREGPGWSVWVEFLAEGKKPAASRPSTASRVDYKEVLAPEQFRIFAALRDWRKERAEAEGIPPYAIASNEQLAACVRLPVATVADLQRIDGFGDVRIGKYGAGLVGALEELRPKAEEEGK